MKVMNHTNRLGEYFTSIQISNTVSMASLKS